MKPAELLYWTRAGLGAVVGVISALYDYIAGVLARAPTIDDFLTGLSFALLFFIITYYILKMFFLDKLEKRSKLITTGIGAYFLLWIIVWVLLGSIIKGPI